MREVFRDKLDAIQIGFNRGLDRLMDEYGDDKDMIAYGVKKLIMLRKFYYENLCICETDKQIKDMPVCFQCFDKSCPCCSCDD